jgi:hypothetical protein
MRKTGMSHKCPRCGLFSPEEAIRCDCGYDFETRTVQPSYFIAHILQKHGGAANMLGESARTNIRSAIILLGIAGAISVVGYLASGSLYFFGGAVLWGALYLYRGLRQRRLRDKLLRQSTASDASQLR